MTAYANKILARYNHPDWKALLGRPFMAGYFGHPNLC
jgi:hypothetical protein